MENADIAQVDKLQLAKPTILWIDFTVTTRESELSPIFGECFDVQPCADDRHPEREFNGKSFAGVCFDFDYPDRHLLRQAAELKRRFPSVPMLLMTVQHSEALAIWAYRNGMLDYLVKPIPETELRRCIDRIIDVHKLMNKQTGRQLSLSMSVLPNDVPAASRSMEAKLAPSIYYVQQNFSQRIYSDVVARLCSMSPTHFSRAFKQTFEITFQEFQLRYRVAEACRQLRAPGAAISDIAYGVGFSDASYFARVFKRYVGVPPSEFSSMLETTDNEVWLEKISASLKVPAGAGVQLNDTASPLAIA